MNENTERNRDHSLTQDSPKRTGKAYLLVMMAAVVFTGFYLQFLQDRFYQISAPFYDSVDYYNRVYDIVSVRRQEGLLPAIRDAVFEDTTFCLPYLLAIPFSYLSEPSRSIGLWIEVFYLAIFLVSFGEYLRQVRRASFGQLIACLSPLLAMGAMYRYNSGLTDLRLDLPFAFVYASTACWWFIGHRDSKLSGFAIAGLLAGIGCLTRGTAPVFLVAGFLPIALCEFFATKNKPRYASQVGLAVGLAVLISGWFYIIHFKFLYYYYAIWNTDANAAVGLGRSLRHLLTCVKSIGVPFLAYCGVVLLIRRFVRQPESNDDSNLNQSTWRKIPDTGKFLWVAVAPLILLIVKRADINPYVSLPGAVSLMTLAIVWIFSSLNQIRGWAPGRLAILTSLLILASWLLGYREHVYKPRKSMKGHLELVAAINDDAADRQVNDVSFAVHLVTGISTSSVKSVLQFEKQARFVDFDSVRLGETRFRAIQELTNPSVANWQRVSGDSMPAKIRSLEEFASQNVDYLVLPAKKSIPYIETKYKQDYSIRFSREIVDRYANSGNWRVVSKPLELEPGISVVLYRNVSSLRLAASKKQKSDPTAEIR